jgi:hypothetical protein
MDEGGGMRTLTAYGIGVVIVLAILNGIAWRAGTPPLHDLNAGVREYLKSEPGTLRLSLEWLCDAIDREEAAKRRGEDWSIARDYVRSRLRRLA